MSFFGFSCFSDGAADSASSTDKDGSKTSSSTSLPPTNSVISNQLAMSHYNVGCTLQEEGKLDEAIKSYRDAIAEDDKFCDAHYNLANALQLQEMFEEAVAEYLKTISLNGQHQLAYYNLGYIYFNNLKRSQEGVKMLKKCLEIDPTDVDAQINMALAFNDLGMIDDVIKSYKYIIQHNDKSVMAHFNLGNAYLDVGKVQDALNSFQQVVLLDPEHADAYFNMAIIHEEHAAEESIEKNIRKQELEKAMRSYQAVESLSSKIDKELLEDAKKGIATIEHKLRACDNS